MDPRTFAKEFPQFCDPAGITVPNLNVSPPKVVPKYQLTKTETALQKLGEGVAKDPNAIPNTIKTGPEVIGHYRSFRLGEPWGVFLHEASLKALKEEFHRIIDRDLGKHTDKPLGALGDLIEYILALDYMTGHLGVHYLLDYHAAVLEVVDGESRYVPYLNRQAEFFKKPQPGVLLHLEEAWANFEGLYNFTNPGYTDPLTEMLRGHLGEGSVNNWKSYFLAGRFATEVATFLSRQPIGPRDFGKLLVRMTSVGATNYVQVRYAVDHLMREKTYSEMAHRLRGGEFTAFPAKDPPKADNLLKEKPAVEASIWVY